MGPTFDLASGRPAAPLRGLVDLYLGYRADGQPPGVHRGLPSRHLTLVISLDGPVEMTRLPGGGPPLALDALVGGLHAAPVEMARPVRESGVQLALTPRGARVLLGVPAGELGGAVLPLEALLGGRAAELAERLAAAPGWDARFAVLDDVLAARVADRPPPASPEVEHAWRRLRATAGGEPVHRLAEEVGWSRRHLTERFRHEIGLPPKAAARVLRFERARWLLLGGRARLADVAAECGYADQAHLTRDWTDLAGCPPTTWLAEEAPFLRRGYDDDLPFVQDGDGRRTAVLGA